MKQEQNIKSFKINIDPNTTDFDALGHVNNVVYLQWVQDIAEAHWQSLSNSDELEAMLWVALRHEIDYKKEIIPGELIEAETYVASMEGVKSERITIIRNKNGELKAQARTFWCLLNSETKKPMRIQQYLKNLFI